MIVYLFLQALITISFKAFFNDKLYFKKCVLQDIAELNCSCIYCIPLQILHACG